MNVFVDSLLFTWLDVDTFEHAPQVQLTRIRVRAHLQLTVNGSAVSVSGDMQILAGQFVLQSDRLIAAPIVVITIDNPVVAVISFAVFAERAHLLIIRKW